MNLKGHSKFNLKLLKYPEGYIVKKSGTKRLQKQAIKQAKYKQLIKNEPIMSQLFDVPNVGQTLKYCGKNMFAFEMPFYNGRNILDVLERGDITQLDDLIDKLFIYLKWEFDNSSDKFPYGIMQDKLISLGTKIADIDYSIFKDVMINLMDKVSASGIGQPIPVGYCHGDFTFSNMIFTNKIVLIDWLDSFIETPLNDVAKLLQEVNLKWSLLMDNPANRDMTKINIGYEYLRWQITQRIINEFHEYVELIELFYKITLLRIVPYTKKDTKIYRILIKELTK